ncbi:MAG: hypothetical protein LQ342_005530 [Letrouitia transgressa]|nr:MAG: hypothetical protein LQ342_005530 [Letrouitia transgressa]
MVTTKKHEQISPSIDPSKVKLPAGFAVCIIGGSRGIGASIAHSYAIAGASTIIIASRNISDLNDVAAKCSSLNPDASICCEKCDIASNESVSSLASLIKSREARLDVVVVNSGYYGNLTLRVTDGDPAEFKQCLEVNALGTYHVAHHLVPVLLQTPGARAFIAVASAAAWITDGIIANTQYCVSKMAQMRIIEMMANQYREEGLLAVGVHPGAVVTDMSLKSAPEAFRMFLVDSVDLCGGFLVWLTKAANENLWLTGRFVSAKWDVDELVERKREIQDKDLLKASLAS